MNTLEDRLRAALEETAEEISPHSVPPLRLNRARRLGLPGFADGHRWAAWLAPLAAAAAVAVVIIASVTISGTLDSGPQPTVPSGLASVPPYYVALRLSSHNSCCQAHQPLVPKTYAVVVSTATGAVLARVAPPAPDDTFTGVTGAANDRTFVLGVQRYGSVAPTRFYQLRINPLSPSPVGTIAPTGTPSPYLPSGSPSSLRTIPPTGSASPSTPTGSPSPYSPTGSPSPYIPTGSATPIIAANPFGSHRAGAPRGPVLMLTWLRPLHIPPDKSEVTDFALSPQGTSLAVLDLAALHVISLVTGAEHTWDRPSCVWAPPGSADSTHALLSWAANGRMLAWACNGGLTGIYLLDTTAPGRNQIPNSRLAVRGVGDLVNNQILQQVLLTADGRTVVALTVLSYTRHGLPTLKLAEFSASTGKLLRVLNHLPVSNFKQVMWSSPSGQALLVSNTTPYQGRRSAFLLLNDAGVLTGQHFAPLPHWSLDTLAAAW